MNNPNSSRWAETEIIELIANLCAAHSHHYELMMSIQSDLQHPELYTEEQINEMQEESVYHNNKLEELTEKRRQAMRVLREMVDTANDKRHCILKHSICCYQFAQELRDTDQNNTDYMELAEYAYQYMYECVSKYLWVDVVTCWRCLKDIFDERNNRTSA